MRLNDARNYLRLFRAQTAPATILLILVPFLQGGGSPLQALVLGVYALLAHWLSFGMNSLQDWVGGWDKRDGSKAHHPLSTGEIKVEDAVRVIHWGLPGIMVYGTFLTLWLSPSPLWALIALFTWYTWGMAYNLGLSKVSALGFLPISICFTAMAAWSWLLSHPELGFIGVLWLGYVFFTILFQISYSGFVKELELRERSNILVRMGARLEGGRFHPGGAWLYGWAVKLLNLLFGLLLLSWTSIGFWSLGAVAVYLLYQLTRPRAYDRARELSMMSLEEIATIYIPLFLLQPFQAVLLGGLGVVYFYGMNRWLWEASFPRV